MERRYNRNLLPNARDLRREMTREERHLWYDFLSNHPLHFRRQRVIGNYIVDFYCADAKLVIEVDGSQHYLEEQEQQDKARTEFLEALDLMVLRFSNREVNEQFASVCQCIDETVKARTSKKP